MIKIIYFFIFLGVTSLQAQLKIGANTTTISPGTYFEVECQSGKKVVVTKDSAKVGIGTVMPSHRLHVVDSTQDPIKVYGLKSGSIADSVLVITSDGLIRRINASNIKPSSFSEPWFNAATNTEATSNTQNIYQLGRVGINTNNPLDVLDIKADTLGKGLRISNSNTTNFGTIGIKSGAQSSADRYLYYNNDFAGNASSRAHSFASGGNEHMSILQNGFVGIGTTNPLSRLVVGAGTGYEELNIRSGGASNASLKLSATGTKGREYAIFSTGTGDGSGAGNLNFFDLNKNTSRMLVDTNGNVGINTTQPKNRFEISHGTGGNSGLRFTNLNSSNTAKSASSVGQKYLSVDGNGDVVLANIADEVISVTGLAYGLTSPVAASTFQAGTFENNYSATDSTVIYVNQTDGTQWIYTAANGGQYKSYIAPASTEWYLAGGTLDAGSNKTGAIYRTGNVGIGNQNPQSRLVVGAGTGYEELNVRSGGASNAALKMSATGVDGREYSVYSTGTGDGSGAGNFAIYDNNANLNRVLINKNGNVGMGDLNAVDTSAQLEVKSTIKGFLPPRMNKVQRDAIVNPASGLIVYCTNCNNGSGCLQVNDGTPADPSWSCLGAAAAPNVVANCDGFSTGNFFNGVALSGATYKVTVTNNSFTNVTMAFQSSDITLSGVSGMTVGTPTGVPALTAGSITLVAGQAVVLTYPITGTPSATGTLSGNFTKLALNCTKTKQVNNTAPTFNCNGTIVAPNNFELLNGSSYTGAITIPYTVIASGDAYPAQTITSNGISFTRNAGTYTAPSGTITYTISGTYTGTNNNTFNITTDANAGGCSITIFDAIRGALANGGCASCAAYDAAGINDVVQVTANEFNALSTIIGITNFGRKNVDDNKSAGTSAYSNNMFNNNITVGAYPFAFSTLLDASGAGVKLITQSRTTTGGSSVIDFNTGACKAVSGAAGLYYFVMKRPNVQMPANTNIAVKGFWNGWGTTSGGSGCDGCLTGTPSGYSTAENSKTCTKTGGTVTTLSTGTPGSSMYLNYNIKWTTTKQW